MRVQDGVLIRDEDEEDWTNGRPARPTKKLIRINIDPELVKQVDHWAVDHDLYRYEAWEELLREGLLAVVLKQAQVLAAARPQ